MSSVHSARQTVKRAKPAKRNDSTGKAPVPTKPLVKEGHPLPLVPMGDRVPFVVAAWDVLPDDTHELFELPYQHGMVGPFYNALASRYGVSTRSAAQTRELIRFAGLLGYMCEREGTGRISSVIFAKEASGLSRNPSKRVTLAASRSKRRTEVLVQDDGTHCNGQVLQRLIEAAAERGDVELRDFQDKRPGRPECSRRVLLVQEPLRELYRASPGNQHVDLSGGWERTVNQSLVGRSCGRRQYEHHGWCSREIRELRAIEGEVDRYNAGVDGGIGTYWRGQYFAFAGSVTRHHLVFQRTVKLGGRMYSPLQNLPSRQRLELSLQGSPAYEEDFSALHPTLVLHQRGLVAPDNLYDFVTCDGLSSAECRAIVKFVVNCTLNCRSTASGAKAAASNVQRKERELAKRRGTPPRKMARYVHAIAKHVYRALPALFENLSEDTGKRLHRADSDIARRIIREFVVAGLPVMNVHDSFVVRFDDRRLLHDTMQAAYHEATGFRISTKAQWLENGRPVSHRFAVESGATLAPVHVTAEEVERHSGNRRKEPKPVAPAPELPAETPIPAATTAREPVPAAPQPGPPAPVVNVLDQARQVKQQLALARQRGAQMGEKLIRRGDLDGKAFSVLGVRSVPGVGLPRSPAAVPARSQGVPVRDDRGASGVAVPPTVRNPGPRGRDGGSD